MLNHLIKCTICECHYWKQDINNFVCIYCESKKSDKMCAEDTPEGIHPDENRFGIK
jgi:hypothetical protein